MTVVTVYLESLQHHFVLAAIIMGGRILGAWPGLAGAGTVYWILYWVGYWILYWVLDTILATILATILSTGYYTRYWIVIL